jgi:hypothetical protein
VGDIMEMSVSIPIICNGIIKEECDHTWVMDRGQTGHIFQKVSANMPRIISGRLDHENV